MAQPGLPVMEGKCLLFKEFANIDAFPICIDTRDTEEFILGSK
jgi:malate dehydrogenase (oxaloacetate-decarboxylating)